MEVLLLGSYNIPMDQPFRRTGADTVSGGGGGKGLAAPTLAFKEEGVGAPI